MSISRFAYFPRFISPIATGVASAMIFSFSRFCVLRRSNAYKLSFFLLPLFVFITVWINVWFVLTKGAAKSTCLVHPVLFLF